MPDTKKHIEEMYSTDPGEYDDVRLVNQRGLLLSRHDIRLVERMLNPPAGAKLLEIGAGTGRFTMPTLERGYSVTATDINETLLSGLRAKVARAHLEDKCVCQIESVFELSFDDSSQDYVYSIHVLPRFVALDDQIEAIKEIGRVLKPGGRFFFNYRNSKSPYNLLYKGHAASPTEIGKALNEAGMTVVKTRGKHFSNRKLYNKMPMPINNLLSSTDRLLENVATRWAWDVFVLAEKTA